MHSLKFNGWFHCTLLVCLQQLSPVSPSEQAMVEALPMVRRVPVTRPPASQKPRVIAPHLPPSGDFSWSKNGFVR